jgi:hypothetical protein
MPEEIHNWLINFQGRDISATTSIDALMAKLGELRASVAQTNAALGGLGGAPTTTTITGTAESMWGATTMTMPVAAVPPTASGLAGGGISPYAYSGMFDVQMAEQEAWMQQRAAQMQAARGQGLWESFLQRTTPVEQQTWGGLEAQFSTITEPITRQPTPFGGLEVQRGYDYQLEQLAEFQAAYGSIINKTPQMVDGLKSVSGGMKEVGDSAGKVGSETSRMVDYTIRYLIRYFLIWQTMRTVQELISKTTEAIHEQQWAMHDLQTATQATDDQMQAYQGTLLTTSLMMPAVQPAALVGALPMGEQATQRAAQLAQATRQEPETWIAFLRRLQEIHGYTAGEIENDLDRIIVAYSNATLAGDNFFSNYPKWMNEAIATTGAFADAVERAANVQERQMNLWQRLTGIQDWGAAAQRGELVQELQAGYMERPAAERRALERQFRREMGFGEPLIDVGVTRTLPEFYQWLAESQTTMGPPPMAQAAREGGWQFATGFAGTMTQAQFDKLSNLVDVTRTQWDEQKKLGHITEKSFWVGEGSNKHLETIKNFAEVISIATSEMNQRQKEAVYNIPSGAQGILLSVAAMTGAAELRGGGGATSTTPSQTPAQETFNWGDIYLPMIMKSYQYGGRVPGPVGQPQLAVVHGGEEYSGVGGGAMSGTANIKVESTLLLDKKQIAKAVSEVQGHQVYQALRASGGLVGSILSAG